MSEITSLQDQITGVREDMSSMDDRLSSVEQTVDADSGGRATERARDAATRAERAADQTDARVRDADRWMRWGIGVVLGAILGQVVLTLGLFDRVSSIQQQITGPRRHVLDG